MSPAIAQPDDGATASYPAANIAEQRENYRLAHKQLANGRYAEYRKTRQQLDNYPLSSYLDYLYLQRHVSSLDSARIDEFEKLHGNKRLARQLRKSWLNNLARRERWQSLVDHYDPTLANDALRCSYAVALYRTGSRDIAMDKGAQLWLSEDSRPKQCDDIFHLLQENGRITQHLAWQRFLLAYEAGELQLANYLKRFLNDAELANAELLLTLYRKPGLLQQRWAQLLQTPEMEPVKVALLKRYARKNLANARSFIAANSIDSSVMAKTAPYLMTRQALQSYQEVPLLYKELKQPGDSTSLNWLLRAYLSTANWPGILETIERLPEEEAGSERWRYWHYRSKELMGDLDENDKQEYTRLTNKRSFYSFYAANNLGEEFQLQEENSFAQELSTDHLLARKGVQRALEHFIQEELVEARRELRAETANYSEQQHLEIALLAHQFGWHDQAITSAISANAWNHLRLRFPDVYRDFYARQAWRHNYPLEWIYATGRQESAFARDARSPAGAVGLMQLMPGTAKQQARESGLRYDSARLTDEAFNIRIAGDYLGTLYQRYSANRVLASAAYNAGPHRIDRWLASLPQPLPLDAWIETIPFSETRQYTQNILSFSLIYQKLYPQNIDSASQLVTPFIGEHEKTVHPIGE